MIGIFIDGPLVGQIQELPPVASYGSWNVMIPKRVTECDCNPFEGPGEVISIAETVSYKVVCYGPKVVIMAIASEDKDILRLLKQWVTKDLNLPEWHVGCRDKGAFQ